MTVCVLDDHGKLYGRAQVRKVADLLGLLERLPGRCQVCYEASTGYGTYFDLLTKVASRVVVAHPGLLRLIFRSKKKNDRQDALKLAVPVAAGSHHYATTGRGAGRR